MVDKVTLTKGSTVEVSSDEPGFDGAWYVATLIDVLEPSSPKKKNINRYLVKYHTLYNEDNTDEHLTETVDPSFVRPLPTESGNSGGNFEVSDLVDAYHKEGWWIGVVSKVVVIDGEIRNYVVAFQNPSEEFEFERNQLRVHVDWVDSRWVVPPKKTLDQEQEVTDKTATQTSESNNEALSGFTSPSKEALKTDTDKLIVGGQLSAEKKSRSRKKRKSNSEMVGARISVEEESRRKRSQSSSGSKGNTKVKGSMMETSGSQTIHQDSPLVEQEMIITEICETEDGKSQQKRKRGRPPKLQNKKPNGSLEGSSCCSPPDHHDKSSGTPNPAIVNNGGPTTEHQQDWPFIKGSPIWATIESQELYKTPPQKPHFSPLKKIKEDYREGLAIAHMVTFANIVQKISNLQLTDPDNIINNSLEALGDLETQGFDVSAVRARLNNLLTLKVKVGQLDDKLKKAEKEIETCNLEKSTIEEEMSQLEVKMKELEEKMMQTLAIKNDKDDEIVKLQTDLHLVSNQIKNLGVDFEKLAATPL